MDYFDTVCNSDLVDFLKQSAEEDRYVYRPAYTTVQLCFVWQKVSYEVVRQHSCRTCCVGPSYPCLDAIHCIISCIKVGETSLSRNKVVPCVLAPKYAVIC